MRTTLILMLLATVTACGEPGGPASDAGEAPVAGAAPVVNDPRLEDRRWQLVELAGQAVETSPGSEGAYLELESAQSRISGNASCNRFSGSYELRAGGRLRLGPEFATTRMACPDLERESAFLDVLARADNYTIAQGQLALNVARMAPLARFVETGN